MIIQVCPILIVLCVGHRSERKGNNHIVKKNVGHLVAVSEHLCSV